MHFTRLTLMLNLKRGGFVAINDDDAVGGGGAQHSDTDRAEAKKEHVYHHPAAAI